MSIYHNKHDHIMAQEKVTEFEPDEQQIDAPPSASKYGPGIVVENKGLYVLEQSESLFSPFCVFSPPNGSPLFLSFP